jgi:hypothetical protein
MGKKIEISIELLDKYEFYIYWVLTEGKNNKLCALNKDNSKTLDEYKQTAFDSNGQHLIVPDKKIKALKVVKIGEEENYNLCGILDNLEIECLMSSLEPSTSYVEGKYLIFHDGLDIF